MVGKDFTVGDLVWAQMKSYPPWPATIVEVPATAKPLSIKRTQHYVYFFGSQNYGWIQDEKIFPHEDRMIQTALESKKKSAVFLKAIDEIANQSKRESEKCNISTGSESSGSDSDSDTDSEFDKAMENNVEETSTEKSGPLKKLVSEKGKKVNLMKRKSLESTKKKSVTKKRSVDINGDETSYKVRKLNFGPDSSLASTSQGLSDENSSRLPFNILRREFIRCPPLPQLDIPALRDSLLAKDVRPTKKKIGFLGLGLIGCGIVKNLLNSGHDVTVWNRTQDKCKPFISAGAHGSQTPADVIQSCDITFSCVSDPMVVKKLVFENCGILKGLEGCSSGSKAYVELTGIDPETSQEIAREICGKGGLYLEAPVHGSRQLAEDGQLSVIAAGDRELFKACESCFSALAKHAYFVSLDVGNACKMSLVLSTLKGTVLGALGEALTMIERCKLSPDNFLEILDLSPLGSPLLRESGQTMKKRDFVTDVALKHQQKDMSLMLSLANSLHQPLLVAAAANETYKHAKQLRYIDHGVSAIIQGTKY